MALEKAPKIEEPFMWECFCELGTLRPQGLGLFPIPLDKMYWYAERRIGLPDEDIEPFIWIMGQLDRKLLEIEAKKDKTAKP